MALKRRRGKAKKEINWEELVEYCLTRSGNDFGWGCLNRKGELFRIATLDSVQVPKRVTDALIESGQLVLRGDKTHYTYVTPRKRRSFS